MNHHPSFNEELAAHLAAQAHPKPHPQTYQHGYTKPVGPQNVTHRVVKNDAWVNGMLASESQHDKMRLRDFNLHPGPITMEEPRGWNWGGIAITALYLAAIGAAVAWATGWSPA